MVLVLAEGLAHGVQQAPADLKRIVVGVDPSGGVTETGIVVVARKDDHFYVLDDRTAGGHPSIWAKAVVTPTTTSRPIGSLVKATTVE